MTNQQLTQSVWSRLGGKLDLAPAPLILAKANEAIKIVSKQMVLGGNPLSYNLIKSSNLTIAGSDKMGFKNAALPASIIRSIDRLHAVTCVYNGTTYIMEPVRSWTALKELPDKHNKPYYKLHENTLYFRLPSNNTPSSITTEHYQYLSISEFPFELIDVLLDVLIPMFAASQPAVAQAPQPNA